MQHDTRDTTPSERGPRWLTFTYSLHVLHSSVALEIGKRNVRINAVGPGATMTPILAGVPEEVLGAIAAKIPRGRIATTSEIVPAYVFLASDESDAFVGQCLSPNGGDAFL